MAKAAIIDVNDLQVGDTVEPGTTIVGVHVVASPDDETESDPARTGAPAPQADEIVAPPASNADLLTIGTDAWHRAMFQEGRTEELAQFAIKRANDELQSEIEKQREPEELSQPYASESGAYRADLQAKRATLSAEIGKLEAQLKGLTARIDDKNSMRNAVDAGLSVLK